MVGQYFDDLSIIHALSKRFFQELALVFTRLFSDDLNHNNTLLWDGLVEWVKGSVQDQLNNLISRDLHSLFITEHIQEELDGLFRTELRQDQRLDLLTFLAGTEVIS